MGVVAGSGLLLPLAADAGRKLPGVRKSQFRVDEKLTDYKYVTTYNNFYEFGTDKSGPAKNSQNFGSVPWTVTVDGEVKRPARYPIEDLLQKQPLEERVYRLRCVEARYMVIPWIGFPLADLIKRVEPTSRAKYVEFTTRCTTPCKCPASARACSAPGWIGRMSRACVSTRPCIRSRCSPSASTARYCRTGTARRSGWRCRGSTASRASSPSCASASSRNSP
jgi:hypothetical protein